MSSTSVSPVQAYFDENASDYSEFFNNALTPLVYPMGRVRSEIALRQIEAAVGLKGLRLVDLGCGTGRMVLESAAAGMTATGVDFSSGMLGEGRKALAAAGPDLAGRADFIEASVFDAPLPDESCDAVTALGLIEYLDPAEAERLFHSAARLLRKGGVFVLETRNRLFNMGSLNSYTQAEVEAGEAGRLLGEIIAQQSRALDPQHLRNFARALSDAARQLEGALDQDLAKPYQPDSDGAQRKVENPLTRWQHTPGQLTGWGDGCGLSMHALSGLHPHPLPSSLEKTYPRFYNGLAQTFEQLSPTHLVLGQCSSIVCCFMRN